jgi:hypothetical protein
MNPGLATAMTCFGAQRAMHYERGSLFTFHCAKKKQLGGLASDWFWSELLQVRLFLAAMQCVIKI